MKKSTNFLFRKTILFSLGIMSFAAGAKAQQIPFYSQYYINPFIYNPAATGMGEDWNTYFIHREQWAGIPGAPVTNAFTLDGPIASKNVGVGLSVYNDAVGITNRTAGYGTYSYKVTINPDNKLFLGVSGGLLANQIDYSQEKVLNTSEAALYSQLGAKSTFDASFGLLYQYKRLQVGYSVPQLFANQIEYTSSSDVRTYYNLSRSYLTTVKYVFDVDAARGITFYPLVLVRSSDPLGLFRANKGAPLQYDFNGVLDWKNTGWAAISYKDGYALTVNAGIRFSGISIGYAYDIPTGAIGTSAGSSSEILLGYSFRFGSGVQSGGGSSSGYSSGKNADSDKKVNAIAKKMKEMIAENANDKLVIDTLKQQIDKISRMDFSKGMKPEMQTVYKLKNVNFAMKSTVLNDDSKKTLDEVVVFLNANPTVKIDIHGHTDDVGEPENNQKLSENRVKIVYDYIIAKGIPKERVTYKAFGASMPLVPGKDAKSRALNRRTEFIITSKF